MAKPQSSKRVSALPPVAKDDIDRSRLADLRDIPEPSRVFNAGDVVGREDTTETTVVATENGGRIVICRTTGTVAKGTQGAGRLIDKTFACPWYDVFLCHGHDRDGAPGVASPFRQGSERIHVQQRTVYGLLGIYYRCGIDVNPIYQRGYVWVDEHRHRLITAMVNHQSTGVTVLHERPFDESGENQYEMIDGKQRLQTIVGFTEGRWAHPTLGAYAAWSAYDRRAFENLTVAVALITGRKTLTERMEIFMRVNAGGVLMPIEHLEHVKDLINTCFIK